MGRSLRNAGIGIALFYLWAYLTGPLGMVIGGIMFLAGFAFGHHAGINDAARKQQQQWNDRRVRQLFPDDAR